MLAQKKTKTALGISVGILLQIAGGWLRKADDATAMLGMVLVFFGMVFVVWGCAHWAEGKGHSKWIGLFGMFSCFGLIVLILLPDHHKNDK